MASPSASEPSSGNELYRAKRAMRVRLLALRDGLPAAMRRRASAAIAERIAELPGYRAAPTVLLTVSFRSEWDTRPLIADALASGKTVALPRVDAEERMLALHRIGGIDDIVPGYLGIPEPVADCARIAPGAIDWVLVPGVAFDAGGRRLGYGGGFYDRLQPLLTNRPQRVAGAFEMQIVDEVPAAAHDHGVDLVVTETRTLAAMAAP